MNCYLLIPLIIATVTDIKTRTIPVCLFPITGIIWLIYRYCTYQPPDLYNWFGLVLFAVSFFFLGIKRLAGGGDILMFSVLGLILGIHLLRYLILLSVISTIFLLIKGKGEYPLAPFAAISYFILLLWEVFL